MNELKEFLISHGVDIEPILDGSFQRFDLNGTLNGWFVGHEFQDPYYVVATLGNWKTGEVFKFESKREYSEDEKKVNKERLDEANKKQDEKLKEEHERAARVGQARWKEAREGNSPYLNKKGLGEINTANINLRIAPNSAGTNDLIIPVKDSADKIWGIQKIQPNGEKFFQPGTKKQGNFFTVGSITPSCQKIYIAEGIATAISIYVATNTPTICAFDANNLKPVALEIRKKYAQIPIIICGDNDRFTLINGQPKNVGKLAADSAAAAVNGVAILPEFKNPTSAGTDFNDLHIEEGLEVVKEQLLKIHLPNPKEIIKTQSTGFHTVEVTKNKTIYKPCYEDLRRYFDKIYNYKVFSSSKICYVWNGKKYVPFNTAYLENFAQENFFPIADIKKRSEFTKLVLCTNLTNAEWFTISTDRKVNFNNGVLNLKTNKFMPQDPANGFMYVLNYNYEPDAQCPMFDKFLDDVTGKDEEVQKVLLEYIGFIISNDSYWLQKALVLEGLGANGKSTLMTLIRELVGPENCSANSISDLKQESYRHDINGKLLNMTEETPNRALVESSVFKLITGGGAISARPLYANPYTYKTKCKLVFACNEMPQTQDTTYGLTRRLLIVPFKQEFSEKNNNVNYNIDEELKTELPGIFNKCIKAYIECKKRRKLTFSKTIEKANQDYIKEIDYTLDWMEKNIQVHEIGNGHDESYKSISDIYTSYVDQIEKDGHKPVNKIYFGKKISRHIKNYDDRVRKKKIGGRTERVIIAITVDSQEEF